MKAPSVPQLQAEPLQGAQTLADGADGGLNLAQRLAALDRATQVSDDDIAVGLRIANAVVQAVGFRVRG